MLNGNILLCHFSQSYNMHWLYRFDGEWRDNRRVEGVHTRTDGSKVLRRYDPLNAFKEVAAIESMYDRRYK